MNDITMNAWEAISATKAECFITIDDERFLFMQALNLEAKIEKVNRPEGVRFRNIPL